jgi:hypothetical protein
LKEGKHGDDLEYNSPDVDVFDVCFCVYVVILLVVGFVTAGVVCCSILNKMKSKKYSTVGTINSKIK